MSSSKDDRSCVPCESRRRIIFNAKKEDPFKVEEDGSLLFEKEPIDRVGYVRDVKNEFRLIPTHLPCVKRITLPFLQKDGVTVVVNICNHEEHPVRRQDVTSEDCQACPLRLPHIPIDGTLHFP